MAEDGGTGGTGADGRADPLAPKRQETIEALLDDVRRFSTWDLGLNDLVSQLFSAVIDQVKSGPLSTTGDVDSLINALKTKGEGGPGVSGSDVVGGGVTLGDIADFIKEVANFTGEEKKFFLSILLIAFGQADCVCKCICD